MVQKRKRKKIFYFLCDKTGDNRGMVWVRVAIVPRQTAETEGNGRRVQMMGAAKKRGSFSRIVSQARGYHHSPRLARHVSGLCLGLGLLRRLLVFPPSAEELSERHGV